MPAIRLLEDLLSSRARIRVLRVILTRPDGQEWTGRELAALSGASNSQAIGALHVLLAAGVVNVRSVGRALVWSLNPGHVLVPSLRGLFAQESRVPELMQGELRRALRGTGARRAWLFGSLARGEATARSDVDLLVEAADSSSSSRVLSRLGESSSAFLQRYGVPLSPRVILRRRGGVSDNPDLLKAIRQDGVVIEL